MKHLLLASLLLLSLPLNAQKALKGEIDHSLVTFQSHKLPYRNFVLPTSVAGQQVDLRAAAQGQKLLLVTYFAAWCENSHHDFATIKHLQKKFGTKGLGIVGVCNYSEPKEVKEFITKHQPPYPIAVESNDDKQRENTTHYSYRKLCGDTRKWGTPFTLLIEAKNIQADREVLTNEVFAAKGELDKKEAEKFIQQLLQ